MKPPQPQSARHWLAEGRWFLARVAAFVGALFLLAFALRIGTSFVFPFAGGEFHALYRSMNVSRTRIALQIYPAYVFSLAVMASALIWLRYPLGWRALWWAATVIGLLSWLRVCRFPVQSTKFSIVAALGLVSMPIILYAVIRAANQLRMWRSKVVKSAEPVNEVHAEKTKREE